MAVYHRKCHTDFFSPSSYHRVGRPSDGRKEEGFETLCTWLEETDCELLTLEELSEKATSVTSNDETYSKLWLKNKLKERYKDHIVFAEVDGPKNVICWRKMASYIASDKWYDMISANPNSCTTSMETAMFYCHRKRTPSRPYSNC